MIKSWMVGLAIATLAFAVTTSAVQAGDVPMSTRRVATGLSRLVYCTAPYGDFSRLFTVQQNGVIRIFDLETATLKPTPFLNFSSLVTCSCSGGDERGALGLAFHPDYDVNGYFYVYYYGGGSTHVRRYSVSADPDVADSTSGVEIISFAEPQTNHNGGTVVFGGDGYLYVGLGDGGNFDDSGSGHAVGGNAQSGSTLLGKIIRIDVDGGFPYAIPADNPFVGDPTHLDEIWAKGVRNPYHFSFDRETNDLWIGDVGQGAREEVDFYAFGAPAGANFGWRCMEGASCYLSGCTCLAPSLTLPAFDYTHAASACSVIGGYCYRGCAMEPMHGLYFFADYCNARIYSGRIDGTGSTLIDVVQRQGELTPPPGQGIINQISGFGEDAYGEIYICSLGGSLYKIVPADIDDTDCNGNFIVDSCESTSPIDDCNGNGVSDLCDISSGTSTDCNGNDIPDECDVESGVLADCDGNGVADLCEIESGAAEDCNDNGIVDSCDIASGVLTDGNGDGLPDECDYFVLRTFDTNGAPGGSATITNGATAPEEMAGFSFGYTFDPTILTVTDTTVVGTVAESADFVAPDFDNAVGYVTVGVVVDLSPPIEDTIAAGVDQPVFKTMVDVDSGALIGTSTMIDMAESTGPLGVDAVITVGSGFSQAPVLVAGVFTIGTGGNFSRGDANADGTFDIADPVFMLAFLFSSGPALDCDDAGDTNDDGVLDIADPVASLSTLFSSGPNPPAPYPGCGTDPTTDTLSCGTSTCP